MNELFDRIAKIGIVPVIKIEDVEQAVPLAAALCEGGLPVAEVTFRTDCAAEAIEKMCREFPQMLIGAGTVLTVEQVDKAVESGAQFIVSPGFQAPVVEHCIKRNIPVIPGCATPSEVEQAIGMGLSVVKFFPAEAAGGLAMIKAMSAPYRQIKFMPTGGINVQNLNEYLSCPSVLACGGSWMVPEKLIQEGNFSEITALTQQAVHTMLGFFVKHVGVNANDGNEALEWGNLFGSALDQPVFVKPQSVFTGSFVEVMSGNGMGTHGHIAIGCNDVSRAVNYLEYRGVSFDYDTVRYDQTGRLEFIYLSDEIGGFRIHLVAKG
jgi:2-dehydro-3-deoxyphosphogluconate aldolase/(4S)-4-hydroxy-2-oxoglutarate aldolase